jgi:acetyl-CoA carboxylase biotin carboxyl carrier protein
MPQGFDLERLKTLIEMMEEHGLTEISLRRGDEHWRLRRGSNEVVQMVPAGPFPGHLPHMPPAPAPSPQPEPGGAGQQDGTIPIKSPTVGTFYAAPSPEDPPFVTVGSRVNPDTIVCIVEAMKVFNQIPAEVSGTIVEVLVKNGDSIEFGQPLYKVRPG